MSSDVDLANEMVACLGDDATIASLDPPEGSPQAGRAAKILPRARDMLLEMHNWGFATRRIVLTETTVPTGAGWQYAYFLPANCLQLFAVLPPDSASDYTYAFADMESNGFSVKQFASGALYVTQDFARETNDNGEVIVLTNQYQAIGRYIIRVTDTTKFSPLFNEALIWLGASKLAGPLLKGDVGAAEAKRCLTIAETMLRKAAVSDSRQQQITPTQNVAWIGGR
jgi:hypothetical protein